MPTPPRKLTILEAPLSRRELIGGGVLGLAALALPLSPACLPPPGPDGGVDAGPDAGPDSGVNGIPDAGCPPSSCKVDANTLIIPVSLVPVGSAFFWSDPRYSDPVCGFDNFVVIQPTAGNFIALSSSCTHSCCTVTLGSASQCPDAYFNCPCHQSCYDVNGNVLNPPAPANLPTIPVCSDGCGIYVQLA